MELTSAPKDLCSVFGFHGSTLLYPMKKPLTDMLVWHIGHINVTLKSGIGYPGILPSPMHYLLGELSQHWLSNWCKRSQFHYKQRLRS